MFLVCYLNKSSIFTCYYYLLLFKNVYLNEMQCESAKWKIWIRVMGYLIVTDNTSIICATIYISQNCQLSFNQMEWESVKKLFRADWDLPQVHVDNIFITERGISPSKTLSGAHKRGHSLGSYHCLKRTLSLKKTVQILGL